MILLRKYGLWLTLAMIVGIAGAWMIHASSPKSYLSTASVDVEPRITTFATPLQPNMGTEQVVATSGVVLANTALRLGSTPASLARALSASVARTTGSTSTGAANVLTIGCTMPTPTAAQRCATAAASAYVAFRNDTQASPFTRSRDPLQVTMITPATLPGAPAGVGKKILLPIGALLGLALGFGAIFVRDHFDKRVRDPADMESCLGGPVLATIPQVRSRSAPPAHISRREPHSAAAESYRYLREHLDSLIQKGPTGGSMLLVTSPQPRDGRTCVAANLATVMAEAGNRVILVDGDVRHQSLSEIFNAGGEPGLAELLTRKASLQQIAVEVVDTPGLTFVPAGDLKACPAEAFQVANLNRALYKMWAQADVVIFDSAPALAASQVVTLARMSDVVLTVADVRHTERDAVAAAAEQIRATGPRIIVGVLNGVPPTKNGQMWPGAARARDPELVIRPPTVPAILASAPPPAPNGDKSASVAQPRHATGPGGQDDVLP